LSFELLLRRDHFELEETICHFKFELLAKLIEEGEGLVFEFDERILLSHDPKADFGAEVVDREKVILPEAINMA